MPGLALLAATGLAGALLYRVLRRRDREGWWDKEGHGSPEHPHSGVHYRPLEVPPSEPFGRGRGH
ncbi:MAG: hypothetical protein S0880_07790 [Actinomycetota bacterium]|nr:hypothetical protein [Actinomycetota bacterium]